MSRLTPTAVKLLAELNDDTLAVVLNLVKVGFVSKKVQRHYPDRLLYTAPQARALRRSKNQTHRAIQRVSKGTR